MSRLMVWEVEYLLSCALLGVFLAIVYDVLSISRIVFPRRAFLTGAEDILYWLAAAFALFLVLYRGNDGRIRWFAVAMTASAMLLFHSCLSRFLVPLIGGLLRAPIDFIGKVLKRSWKTVKIKGKKLKEKRWFHGRDKVEKEKEQ